MSEFAKRRMFVLEGNEFLTAGAMTLAETITLEVIPCSKS
jgi:hypothetical protein